MWAVILIDKNGQLLDFVGYENKPTFQDLFFLGKEVCSDTTFSHYANDINQVIVKFFPDMNYDDIIKEIETYNINL